MKSYAIWTSESVRSRTIPVLRRRTDERTHTKVSRASIAAVTAICVGLLGSGCVPARPSGPSWVSGCLHQTAVVASAVSAADLVLQLADRDRLLRRYAPVALVHVEESANNALSSLSSVQPPPAWQRSARAVIDVLGRGVATIRAARTTVADDGSPDGADVANLHRALREAHRQLADAADVRCASTEGSR